jgi:hypothetical protein
MGKIESKTDKSKDMVTVTASGKIATIDLARWINAFYQLGEGKTTHIAEFLLFDLREADLADITAGDIRVLAQKIGSVRRSINRKTGKTAFVTAEELTYDLGKMFEAYIGSIDDSLEIRIFRDIDEAKEWLGVK